MTNLRSPISLLLGIALGVGGCALAVWNPFGWAQIDRLLGRSHELHQLSDSSGNTLYTCGMHPHVVQDEPGTCPICGMNLVPMSGSTPEPASGERRILYWRAPMDPSYMSDEPGKSPMGMDLVPVYEDETSTDGSVRVSPSFLQNFAVRTTEVLVGSLPIEIRTVGILAHNDEQTVSVNTKFEGWIEEARVNNVGEHVAKGDVLFEIYSPELVTTQREYLAAMDYVERLKSNDAYPEAIERAESLLKSTRERLRYWDVSDEQIEGLRESKQVNRTVAFVSPASGSVVAKISDSFEGMRVTPGMTLLKIADHATLWVEAEFYERDIRYLREGQRATVEVDAFPGRRWAGTIRLLRPALNPETRTLTAFIEVANSDLKLRPQMYANVYIRVAGASDALIVPAQAVLHSGERAVVIVAKGNGLFEPREVQLGISSGDQQQVTDGLFPGDKIVVSSQFLIDSESNLKAAISQILSDRGSESDQPARMRMDTQN
ncbi:MAG: efflux RND transporter periplasmic adaptor subunit [Acidobacteria bacterium]|nr:MAG: efflux RND transporter periplasmic adaptor subunit [Acidobacteriota bacterium]